MVELVINDFAYVHRTGRWDIVGYLKIVLRCSEVDALIAAVNSRVVALERGSPRPLF